MPHFSSPQPITLFTSLSDLESEELSAGAAVVINEDLGPYSVRGVINKNGLNAHVVGPAFTDERFLLTPPDELISGVDPNPGSIHIMAVSNGERLQAHIHVNANQI